MSQAEDTGAKQRSFFPAVIATFVVVAVIVIVNSSFSGGVYDYEIRALNDEWEAMTGKDVRVAGNVVPGSIRGDLDRLDITFDVLDASGEKATVHYSRVLPDPFAEGREVIVEGTVLAERRIEASNLTVKCPSRYQDGEMTEEESKKYYEEHYDKGAAGGPSASR
jgi:cytochrome c-type biogenesis protein CcmE